MKKPTSVATHTIAIDVRLPSNRRQKQALANAANSNTSHGFSRFSFTMILNILQSSFSGSLWSKAFHDRADSLMLALKFNAMPGVFFM